MDQIFQVKRRKQHSGFSKGVGEKGEQRSFKNTKLYVNINLKGD